MSKKDKQDKKYKSNHELESVEPRLLFSAGLEGVLAAEQLETPPDDYSPSVVEQTIDSHSTESTEASFRSRSTSNGIWSKRLLNPESLGGLAWRPVPSPSF